MHRAIKPTPSHDVFWIYNLWRALHGGDPSVEEVAASAIASLAQFLPSHADSFGLPPLPMSAAMKSAAEDEGEDETEESASEDTHQQPNFVCCDPGEFSIDHYYFETEGFFYRLDRPAFACLPTAA